MMGYLLAMGGMYEDKNVTCLPSYGAEVRGGTANCTVVISTEEIASPVASEPEFAVFMNQPSLMRFQNQVQSGGAIFLNTSLIEGDRSARPRHLRGAISELAKKLEDSKASNMIMLGAFLRKSGLVSFDTMVRVLKETFGHRNPSVLRLNRVALQLGYDYLE